MRISNSVTVELAKGEDAMRAVHEAFAGTVATHASSAPTDQPPSTRKIRVGSGAVEAAIWQRDAIPSHVIVPGPAIIEQADTTTLVESGWIARRTKGDALLLERSA